MEAHGLLTTLSRSNQIHQLTKGYGTMACELVEAEWLPYLLVLKFHHLGGGREAVLDQMRREAERVYATVLTRILRKPHAVSQRDRLPRWILAPDFPVWKHEKVSMRSLVPNDGLHLQGVAVLPPDNRLAGGLDRHFRDHRDHYCRRGSALVGLCATPITSDVAYVNAYNFKALRRGRASADEIIVLPRHPSEVVDTPRRASEPWRPLVHERV